MFFRLKTSGPRTYLQIVENRWEGGASSSTSSPHSAAPTNSRQRRPCRPAGLRCPLLRTGAAALGARRRPARPAPRPAPHRRALIFGRLWDERLPAPSSRSCWPAAASGSPSSGRSSSPSCIACWSPAPTGPARSGGPTTTSPALTTSTCTTSTAPWPGSARN